MISRTALVILGLLMAARLSEYRTSLVILGLLIAAIAAVLTAYSFVRLIFPRTSLVILLLLVAAVAAGVIVADRTVDGVDHGRVVGDIKAMNEPLKLYHALNGSYPTTEQGLRALVEEDASSPHPTDWEPFYGVPKDPWNTDYVYRCPGVRHPDEYDLFSAGPDHEADTQDDVWEDWRK